MRDSYPDFKRAVEKKEDLDLKKFGTFTIVDFLAVAEVLNYKKWQLYEGQSYSAAPKDKMEEDLVSNFLKVKFNLSEYNFLMKISKKSVALVSYLK